MTPNERLLAEALEQAKSISRRTDLNDEERADLAARVETIERMKSDVKRERELREAVIDDLSPAERKQFKSLGQSYVDSEQFKNASRDGFRGVTEGFEYKAEPTPIDETTALANLVIAQRVNQIEPLASYPTGVAALIPVIPTGSNAVSYYIEASETHTVAPAAEGTEKGNFTLAGSQVTDEVEVIAGLAAVTRQTLEDAPFMAGFVDSRMRRALAVVEEDQIIDGNGTSPQLNGILARTTSTQSQATDTVFDAIYKAADKCFVAGGYAADGVVIHPTDWQPLALAKDQNDRYYGSGPFAAAVGDTVWGMKVVKSNQITQGTVLTGAFGSAAFLARNGGVTVRTSDSHSDYFKKNKIAVLIEERLALGVPAPLAFCKLTLA